ncbi:zinc finger protein 69 homolog B [Anabrus simplex]|uniref:zinc finger protein 69 homolog B n=1 Tax=Anabrus simplex TaxID=316456 RepID=UPI0035A3CE5C
MEDETVVVESESEEVQKLQSQHNILCKEQQPDLEISSPLQNLSLKSVHEEQMVILKEECKPFNHAGIKIEDGVENIKQEELTYEKISVNPSPFIETLPIANLHEEQMVILKEECKSLNHAGMKVEDDVENIKQEELANEKISVNPSPFVETIQIANLHEDIKHEVTVEDDSHAKQNAPQTDISVGSITKLKTTDCPICTKVFRTLRELRIHLYAHKKEDQVSCLICGMSFGTQISLTRHAAIHAERISLSCSVCDLTLNDKMELEQHWATHPVKKPFSCSLCKGTYSTKFKLKRHLRKVHCEVDSDSCKPDEVYSFVINYKSKLRIMRLFHCKDCPKFFRKSFKLGNHYIIDHLKKNTMATQYACRECSKPYYKISRLADHYQRTHF